ncbi:MAG: hypothetical protein Kow0075_14360 [Salibacteraceae bacterium]
MTKYALQMVFGLLLLLGWRAEAQLPLSLQLALERASAETPVHLYIKADADFARTFCRSAGGVWKRSVGEYQAIVLPASEVHRLAGQGEVEAIHFDGAVGEPLLDQSMLQTGITAVQNGEVNALHGAYTGEGVIVGVIDAGIDINHPDFKNPEGTTRILEIWDQNMPYNSQRTPWLGYGQVWDSADINAGNCPHQDQAAYYGHGTNVAGIAAGNGLATGQFKGAAPDANLIIVSNAFSSLGWTGTVADAVEYIFTRAEQLGMPAVINASIGSYAGSHDARDLATRDIEQQITKANGRIMVCAAGNSGAQAPYHLGYEASSDTTFTWFAVQNGGSSGGGAIYFEMYGNVGDMERLKFAIGADRKNPTYKFQGAVSFDSIPNRLFQIYQENLISNNGNYLAKIQTWADSANGTYRLQVFISMIDSTQYNYRLMITGQGRFDLWSGPLLASSPMLSTGLPTVNQYSAMSGYRAPDLLQSIVGYWACSEKVITVGNYQNRKSYTDVDENVVNISGALPGQISASSSSGPTRLGAIKPDVCAPGDNTITAGAAFHLNALLGSATHRWRVAVGGYHHLAGGTSSASPVVAGLAALYLQMCPNAGWANFKDALHSGALGDDHTGTVPNHRWGVGKVNAIRTLVHSTPHPMVQAAESEFCAGDSLRVEVSGNWEQVYWSHGDSHSVAYAKVSGQYFAMVTDSLGCKGYSDTADIFRRPLPPKPVLSVDGPIPACLHRPPVLSVPESAYGAFHWSTGDKSASIVASEAGSYYCKVLNKFNCHIVSDTVEVYFHTSYPRPVLFLKANDELWTDTDIPAVAHEWNLNGHLIPLAADSVLKVPEPGYYRVVVIDSNGCHWKSNEIAVGVLSLTENRAKQTTVYPNPTNRFVYVSGSGIIHSIRVLTIDGRAIITQSDVHLPKAFVDLDGLPAGVFMMEVSFANETENHLIVKR